jgi:hypothetical protein
MEKGGEKRQTFKFVRLCEGGGGINDKSRVECRAKEA